jgi:hypothetical protein
VFFLDHEPHVAARRNGRDKAHAIARSRACYDRVLTFLSPCAVGPSGRVRRHRSKSRLFRAVRTF